ncbi:MAG: hypothetical protein V1820_04610 [archaeon]
MGTPRGKTGKFARQAGRVIRSFPTLPSIPQMAQYLFWYATVEHNPKEILMDFSPVLPPAGGDFPHATVALHNHTRVNDRTGRGAAEIPLEETLELYGSGSDGLASPEEMLLAAYGAGMQVYVSSDHLTMQNVVTGEPLSDGNLPWGVGFGNADRRKLAQLKADGKIGRAFFALPGAELDVNNVHLLVLGTAFDTERDGKGYQVLNPLFERKLGKRVDPDLSATEQHELFFRYANKVGYRRIVRFLDGLEDAIVVSAHEGVPLSGANRLNRGLAVNREIQNGEVLALDMLPHALQEEYGLLAAAPVGAYPAARVSFDAGMETEVKRAAKKGAFLWDSDAHTPAMVDAYLTHFLGIDPGKYVELEEAGGDALLELTKDLKAALREGRIVGGLNPKYWDPDRTNPQTGEPGYFDEPALRELSGGYFGHLGNTIKEWSAVVPVLEPLGKLLKSARRTYQEKILPAHGDRARAAVAKLARVLRIPDSAYAPLEAPKEISSYAGS